MKNMQNEQLPKYIYKYKGRRVFLAETSDMPGVEPLAVTLDIGAYPVSLYNGCNTRKTYDDDYTEYIGPCKITIADVINVETSVEPDEWCDDYLCEGQWVTKDYAACDKVQQVLCRKNFIGSELREIIGALRRKTDYGWHGTLDNVIPYVDFLNLEEEWNATIRQYEKEYKESVTEDNPYDFPYVMSLREICEQEDIIVSLSDSDVEYLRYNSYYLRGIDTTSNAGGYPRDLHPAIIGFNSFEEAEKMAEENHLDIGIFARRNGWNYWQRKGQAYDAFEHSGECVMDYEEDDWCYVIGLIGLKII